MPKQYKIPSIITIKADSWEEAYEIYASMIEESEQYKAESFGNDKGIISINSRASQWTCNGIEELSKEECEKIVCAFWGNRIKRKKDYTTYSVSINIPNTNIPNDDIPF